VPATVSMPCTLFVILMAAVRLDAVFQAVLHSLTTARSTRAAWCTAVRQSICSSAAVSNDISIVSVGPIWSLSVGAVISSTREANHAVTLTASTATWWRSFSRSCSRLAMWEEALPLPLPPLIVLPPNTD